MYVCCPYQVVIDDGREATSVEQLKHLTPQHKAMQRDL
jgi:hypothetical protein